MALYMSVQAVVLLICTGSYIWWRISTGNKPHVCVGFVLTNGLSILVAAHFVSEWRRLRRGKTWNR